MATAIDVANLFLAWANRDGDLISNLKLQKLLYYAEAWYLANFKKPLFNDEFEAWELGPVIPEIYRHFKKYGALPIKYNNNIPKADCSEEEGVFTKKELEYLKEFYAAFIKYSAHTLVNSTHNETPWKETELNSIISKDIMKGYYSSQIS